MSQSRAKEGHSGRQLFHKMRKKIGWASRSHMVLESNLLSVAQSTSRSTSQSTLKSALSVPSAKILFRESVSSITSDPLLQSTSGIPSLANETSKLFEQSPSHAKEPRQKLLHEALQRLDPQERATIERYISYDAEDISAFVDEAYEAAVDKQKLCEDKRWIWQIGSRTIELRHEAEKVISFLNRFKCVGDLVIKAAPSQAELPWAGFCLLLKVAVSEIAQMAALLGGLDLTLCMRDRLKAYVDFLPHLPESGARENLENSLTDLYALILQFLAEAIKTCQMKTPARILHQVWDHELISGLQTQCDRLADQVHEDFSQSTQEDTRHRMGALRKVLERLDHDQGDLIDILQDIRNSVQILQDNFELSKLDGKNVEEAAFDSYVESKNPRCLEDTRVDLLGQIKYWTEDPDAKCIFWLNGMAGTGKSTIARTLAHTLKGEHRKLATFFFKRGEGKRSDARYLFTTIAAQLARQVPNISREFARVLNLDPSIPGKSIREQFQKLILEPLGSIPQSGSKPSVIVVIIDALDECECEEDVRATLLQLSHASRIGTVRLRFFVTSRPELPIRLGFADMGIEAHHDIILNEIAQETIQHDITLYFQHEFAKLRKKDLAMHPEDPSLSADWPGEENIQKLVEMAIPLFIFAATVCRFIAQGSRPQRRLETILQAPKATSSSNLVSIYLPILNHLFVGQHEWEQEEFAAEFREIVGSIVVLGEPLSTRSLAGLLGIREREVTLTLDELHSVLSVPLDSDGPVKLLHLSFRDFLVDPQKACTERFWINEPEAHGRIANRCLSLLSKPGSLKNNICNTRSPVIKRTDIAQEYVNACLSANVLYACCYWIYHVEHSGQRFTNWGGVLNFMKLHFLHWLEVLGWIGKMSDSISYIDTLLSLVPDDRDSEIVCFLHDCRRFVLQNRQIGDVSPPQLYSTSIIFAPRISIIKGLFQGKETEWVHTFPRLRSTWGPELQKLEGHGDEVRAVIFSPSSRLLASTSSKSVRIWDPSTGASLQTFRCPAGLPTIAFSYDSRLMALSYDKTVVLSDPATGEVWWKLEGHSAEVYTVAFSYNNQWLATASRDRTIRLWDLVTGQELSQFERRSKDLETMAFSYNDRFIASSDRKTVIIWDLGTKTQLHKLEGHSDKILDVVFSHDSQLLASVSWDATVKVWNTSSGEELYKLEDHTGWIKNVVFSYDDQLLASVSSYGIVKLWNPMTGTELHQLKGHSNRANAIAFSHNSLLLASASSDETVRLWDVTTGEQLRELEGHSGAVSAIAFSHNNQLLASASTDKTVRLWDLTIRETCQNRVGYSGKAVAISNDNQLLASALEDKTIRIWDLHTRVQLQKIEFPESNKLTARAFSHDNQLLALSDSWERVVIWDRVTGEEVRRIEGPIDNYTSVAFAPDRQLLASWSMDYTIRLWDLSTGAEVWKLETNFIFVHNLRFLPDFLLLDTEAGILSVRPGLDTALAYDSRRAGHVRAIGAGRRGFGIIDGWATWCNRPLLWLPHEYRGDILAFQDNILVIGSRSLSLIVLRLSLGDEALPILKDDKQSFNMHSEVLEAL